MKITKRILPVLACLLLTLGVFSTNAFADEITPHEEGEDSYYQEDYTEDSTTDNSDYVNSDEGGTDTTDYTESSEESSEESSATQISSSVSSAVTVVGGVDNSGVSSSTSSSPEEEYVVFGSMAVRGNNIGWDMSMIGIICIAIGVVGLICVIVWSISTRDIKKKSDDYIYQTVGAAQKNDSRQAPRQIQKPTNPYNYNDNYSVREDVRRAKQQTQQSRQPQQRPTQQRPAQQRPTQQRPVQQRPTQTEKKHNFDTEEILLEVLRDREKKD